MLEIKGVSTFYGPVQALHDVSLSVVEGEVVTLLGGNGAGKSTTLRTISGLIQPRAGKVEFDGSVISGRSPGHIARTGLVHVPEGRQIFPGLTVLENLKLGTSNGRLERAGQDKAIEEVFSLFLRLGDLRARLGWMLSGGEQQMLAIGRAMLARPRLLLLDEPSLGLAPIMVKQVFAVIQQLRDAGSTILLVEQNALQALKVADRGYVLESGRIVLEGPSPELLSNSRMRDAYLGKRAARGEPTTAEAPVAGQVT